MIKITQAIWAGVDVQDKVKLSVAYLGTVTAMASTLQVIQILAGIAAIAASISVVYKNLSKEK